MHSVVDEYLELIYALHAEGEEAYAAALAERFGVSRANASATVQRMIRDGLVRVEGRRIDLVEQGRVRAEAGLRRHRIAERFLVDVLGMDWAIVHEQARHLERGLSSLLEERMDQRVGRPRTCPHGNPIPRADLDAASYLRDQHAQRLSDAPVGRALSVLLISELIEDRPDLLRTCTALGLLPTAQVVVDTFYPDGTLTVRTNRAPSSVDATLAARVWVVPASAGK